MQMYDGFSRQPVDQQINLVKGTAEADPLTPAIQVGESTSAVSLRTKANHIK